MGGTAISIASREPGRFVTGSLLQNLLLVHGSGAAKCETWNYWSWSISTEWAGYLALPAPWAGMRRPGRPPRCWQRRWPYWRRWGWPARACISTSPTALALAGSRQNSWPAWCWRAGLPRRVVGVLRRISHRPARCAPLWTRSGPMIRRRLPIFSSTLPGWSREQGRENLLTRLPGFVFAGILS